MSIKAMVTGIIFSIKRTIFHGKYLNKGPFKPVPIANTVLINITLSCRTDSSIDYMIIEGRI